MEGMNGKRRKGKVQGSGFRDQGVETGLEDAPP